MVKYILNGTWKILSSDDVKYGAVAAMFMIAIAYVLLKYVGEIVVLP